MQGSHELDVREPVADHICLKAGHPRAAAPVRMKKRADFLRAAKGRRLHARAFSLQVFRRDDAAVAIPRFGLTVTKKTGGAVERNRIKRRLREALRSPALAPETGHDYVIVARRDVLTISFQDLVADLSKTLTQGREARGRSRGGRKAGGDPVGGAPRAAPSA